MDVKNKVAIVTGGTSGIGFATVQALLEHGAKYVAIFDLDSAHTRAAFCIRKIEEQFGKDKADFYTCDVTIESEFAARYDEIVGMQRSVDIVVNYASIVSERRSQHMINTNLTALISCTLIGIDRMGRHHNGKGGAIVNVASIFGLRPSAAFPIYTATKYGVVGFTKALEKHHENLGVRVMAMCPGITDRSVLHQNLKQEVLGFVPEKFLDETFECSKYIQQPENVGEAIVRMIAQAEAGAIWVSENKEAPIAIKDPSPYRDRGVKI
ncbi:15-hydroxyprostaglandin dehydrogenase [NAD(+)] isoform X2 [Copidosoma floridanum]|nr:15-hydroxyprostaglandin dehydrogenase [NAD(+)] isoform X2 [Copidosoma floridanum]